MQTHTIAQAKMNARISRKKHTSTLILHHYLFPGGGGFFLGCLKISFGLLLNGWENNISTSRLFLQNKFINVLVHAHVRIRCCVKNTSLASSSATSRFALAVLLPLDWRALTRACLCARCWCLWLCVYVYGKRTSSASSSDTRSRSRFASAVLVPLARACSASNFSARCTNNTRKLVSYVYIIELRNAG